MQDLFLGGVVEGFYGQPWTHQQRLHLFDQMVDWGLNAYCYSPKDDLKHRAQWRIPYSETEISRLAELVSACNDRHLVFIYGLSPGLDIRFSDASELDAIRTRLQQMKDVGARHFALLFDDLPGNMSDQDQQQFGSVASAQASVTNSVFGWLQSQDHQARLLFCPTPYCDRMVSWKLGGEDYLETIGRELEQQIDVLWTGPEIISADIPVESIERLVQRIGRKPIIWDNLHANDYDVRRLYCGPYCRSSELRASVGGVFCNPNNEFPINYIPLRTFGHWLNDANYHARDAFLNAAAAWARRYVTIDSPVEADDVVLLADCYYLPYADGDGGQDIKQLVRLLLEHPPEDWGDAYERFSEFHRRICSVFEQLTQLHDRDLFYAWSRRVWELKEELDLIQDFASHKKRDNRFRSETHLPFTYRGGLVAELQRQLIMGDDGRFETP